MLSLFSFWGGSWRFSSRLIFSFSLLTFLAFSPFWSTSLLSAPLTNDERSDSSDKSSVVLQLAQAEAPRKNVAQKKKNKSSYASEVLRHNAHVVTLLAGDFGSTDARLAADLANTLDNDNGEAAIRVVPYMGRGGIHNLKDLLFLKGVDMAIVSQGQLGFIEQEDPELYKNIRENIQYLSKIYNAELQILANRNIRTIMELEGKRIVLGKKLGPTDMDARYVFKQLGINVDVVNTDFMAGIDLLENNEVDAIVTLGGAPVEGFKSINNPSRFHFLPITPQAVGIKLYYKIIDEYLPIKLTAEQYPNLIEKNKPISTISSSVVLAIYKWKRSHKRYKKLSRFVEAFFSNLYSLDRKSRHAKWEEINIDAKVVGWSRFGAATEWLSNRRKEIGQEVSAGEMKIAMDAFVRQYSKIGDAEQVGPLLRDDIWAAMTRVFGRYWVVDE